ncbi:carboxypeptidase-like regulatory domain-containing protein [Chitinophaga pinensis]|uniref:Carboxypeptidase-like regulatory domain-containing protein n=1 Tax=Chitinophaga pinensis TaxID=79329 RepID=A0A5C6LSX3_9BACT|nr:carboxypeptidase-like regulatory domain-containing protein [Chitinophaga pinensis]TWV99569.1 carboxypeptidase-like regulatory domain-containing protein [Chitinophaga pinensis]
MKQLFLIVAILLGSYSSYAQSLLNKTVSVSADRKPLAAVLDDISMQGDFHFSYVKEFIHDDSLITINVSKRAVKQVLDILFQGNFQFREIGNQIIIQPGTSSKEKWYVVSGQIKDATTGRPIANASVYESVQLISALTNDQGYFRLRLREKERTAALLTVSKELYRDTMMLVPGGRDQELNADIKPAAPIQLSIVDVNQHTHVEQTFFGRFFLSSRQRMQSLNLSDFFTRQPYQYSLVPALGTHGKLGSQVVNKFSLNLIGGYTAGLSGVEIAGVFNIDQKAVKWVQAAGVFNIVGGHFTGVQIAGIHNHIMDSLNGVQAGGVSNILKYSFRGAQISGIYNQAGGDGQGMQIGGILNNALADIHGAQISGALNSAVGVVKGAQIAGAINFGKDSIDGAQIGGAVNIGWLKIDGAQIAGAINISRKEVDGAQIAGAVNYRKGGGGAQIAGAVNVSLDTTNGAQISGLANYTKVLKGVQIGILNYADSSDGYSLGLINIVRRGYHQILIYNNEMLDLNIAYKSGNRKLYSLLLAGMKLGPKKAYSFGYGIGHPFPLSDRSEISTELTSQFLYVGNWNSSNSMVRLQTAWNYKLLKNVTLFAGPSFTIYYSDKLDVVDPKYDARVPAHYSPFTLGGGVTAWFGWHIGIGFF